MEDVKHLIKDHYIKYASYVILDRAIPHINDGLKPVQRRILWTLHLIDDGKQHKVANVAGQTMALHPHGDAAITDALVTMANKNYLLDTQGNFGNLYTGDPAAASRYIESRLSHLARETCFNKDLTDFTPSYDGRRDEPVTLPAKIPLILMQGVDGIAVGMSTHIFPHNFVELLEAQIAILEKKPFEILPDFPTGGIMDASEYEKGRGKVKLRAKIDVADPKTVVIRQICYGTTTESLIRSIDEAAKKGRLKIDQIHDYTADQVEIEIKLPRGTYAEDLIDQLYHYTDCEVTLHSQLVLIKDNMPAILTVDEVLHYLTDRLQGYLKKELEIERDRLNEKIFSKSLERLFIEKRMYKKIEEIKVFDKIHETIADSLKPYHKQLLRIPTQEDRERLLALPIRRITLYDLNKCDDDIKMLEEKLEQVEKDLKQIKRFTIHYIKDLIKKYGKFYPRQTEVGEIEELDKRAIVTKQVMVSFDVDSGFIGLKVSGPQKLECTNFDKLLVLFDDGSYQVINIPDKLYLQEGGKKPLYVGVADKKTTFSVAYRDPKTKIAFAKRFIVKQFILGRNYRFVDEGMVPDIVTTANEPVLNVQFVPKAKQKIKKLELSFSDVLVKGVAARGVRVASRPVKKLSLDGIPNDQLDLFER